MASARFTALEARTLRRSKPISLSATMEHLSAERKIEAGREKKGGFMEGGTEPSPAAGPLSASGYPVTLCCYNGGGGGGSVSVSIHTHRHSQMSLPFTPCKAVIMCSCSPQEVFRITINHVACGLPAERKLIPDFKLKTQQLQRASDGCLMVCLVKRYWIYVSRVRSS